jgi:3-methyladenine DNA glycosylase AlkD
MGAIIPTSVREASPEARRKRMRRDRTDPTDLPDRKKGLPGSGALRSIRGMPMASPLQYPPRRAAAARRALAAAANATDACFLQRFFKTGPGEYGAGDRFRGIRVPVLRRLSRTFAALPIPEVVRLLASRYHEDRLLALLLLVRRFERAPADGQQKIVELYLRHTCHINNWDLVDLSAPNIIGAWVAAHPGNLLDRLVRSASLWERRIAIVATLTLIRQRRLDTTLTLARQLLQDPEDLLHKATGWMLREAGKRDETALRRFLDQHAAAMPRTMLRYAIERLPERDRRAYLAIPGSERRVRRPRRTRNRQQTCLHR